MNNDGARTQHELVFLSPYRFPGQSAMVLANEDMACWLNGYTALWHPALLWNAKGPPRCDGQYDHEQPQAGFVYALPESPPLYLPDDWEERVRAAGAVAFKATTDRATTLQNLRAALANVALGWPGGLDLPIEKATPFFGIGWGHLMQSTLAEAMEHENLLESAGFWDDVQAAVARLAGFEIATAPAAALPSDDQNGADLGAGGFTSSSEAQDWDTDPAPHLETYDQSTATEVEQAALLVQEPTSNTAPGEPSAAAEPVDASETPAEAWRESLRHAALKLLSAREVLYPVAIRWLDICLLDDNNLEQPWPGSGPLPNGRGSDSVSPLNVVVSASLLEKLASAQPDKWQALRDKLQRDEAEVCGGCYVEREDPLLPLESQLWNLKRGLAVSRELLGVDVRVFARKRFGFHPQIPLLLTTNGLTKALFLCWDETSGIPHYSATVVSWPSPDGKQVDAFVRAPHPADNPATYFNLAHYWFKTTREDHAATVGFLHSGQPPAPWYEDLMELHRLAPVLGNWTTFSRYFNDVMAGEHPPSLAADEFHSDYLNERVTAKVPGPVSGFSKHARLRRRVDACWTFAGLHRGLAGVNDTLSVEEELKKLEENLESSPNPGIAVPGLEDMEKRIASALAARLQARAGDNQPGYMLLNPCAFARRVALELEGANRPLPIGGAVKACQLDGNLLRVVVEVPALGFAWIPREGPPGTGPMASRMRMGDATTLTIRNEFFEAEVDGATGGLKAIRDHKTHLNRLGQRLVFNPGSRMVAKTVRVTSPGPALGEIVSQGVLLGEQEQELAAFTQRLRLWLGRPFLEMRIELRPAQPAAGYPWHAYFGSRFAWRDERGLLLRGINGAGYLTIHPRPQTPDYLELRLARQSTVLFPGGLPFHQRQEGRMLDVILQPEGEEETAFDLGIALDREIPMQTALGWISPAAVVPTQKGPPHVGASGWLFHLDSPNLLLSRLSPGGVYKGERESAPRDAVVARLLECGGHSGHAEFRCVRNPTRAVFLDARGEFLLEGHPAGDAVMVEVTPNDWVQLQVEFS